MIDQARLDQARRQGFYPLVLMLERMLGGAPVGTAASPADERIRFRHDPALTFSTADVASVREVDIPDPGGDGVRQGFEITTTFLGLTGAVSPLPHYMSEEVAQEDPDAPRTRDFLDVFHHRLLSLFYRARVKYDLPAARRADDADLWSRRILALLGIDLAPGELPPGLDPWRLLRLAPLLVERTVTAAGLAAALADALEEDLGEAEVKVEPFAGAWVEIAADQVTRLGRQAGRLGRDCLVGQKVLDPAGRFRVLIGPLTDEQYGRFAGGEPIARAERMIATLVAEPLEHEILLVLREDAAPALRLGSSRLGRNAWVGGQRRRTRIAADKAA